MMTLKEKKESSCASSRTIRSGLLLMHVPEADVQIGLATLIQAGSGASEDLFRFLSLSFFSFFSPCTYKQHCS